MILHAARHKDDPSPAYLNAFAAAGAGLLVGLWMVIVPALIVLVRVLRKEPTP